MTGAYLKFGYHARPTVGVGVALRLEDPSAADGRGVVTEARGFSGLRWTKARTSAPSGGDTAGQDGGGTDFAGGLWAGRAVCGARSPAR